MAIASKTLNKLSGTVTDANTNPLEGLLVQVFDKDLRTEELIGEVCTDRKGAYRLQYDPSKFLKGEKKYPDLAVSVFDPLGKQKLYTTAMNDVVFNAKRNEKINVRLKEVADTIIRRTDEFTFYENTTARVLGKLKINQLDENEKVQDVTFLSKECAIERTHLNYLILSHRLQDKYKIPGAFFYGLFRKNVLLQRNMGDLLNLRFSIGLDTALEPLFYDFVVSIVR